MTAGRDHPAVTIAVPSFNQGRYLGAALESALAQGVAVEVFVADGGSGDDSVAVIERFAPRLAGRGGAIGHHAFDLVVVRVEIGVFLHRRSPLAMAM